MLACSGKKDISLRSERTTQRFFCRKTRLTFLNLSPFPEIVAEKLKPKPF